MKQATNYATRFAGLAAVTAVVTLALSVAAAAPALAQEGEEESRFDGLKAIEGSKVARAYIDPEADFSVFRRVMILEPYVAFRSNWQRDQNRSGGRSIRSSDMERIKADVASLFKQVFTERLEANDGFEVVDAADYDVLLCVANWPAARRTAWQTLLKARAIENLAYSVAVNRVGTDGNGVEYSGDTAAYDYLGDALIEMNGEVQVGDVSLDKAALAAHREAFPAWLDADDFTLKT